MEIDRDFHSKLKEFEMLLREPVTNRHEAFQNPSIFIKLSANFAQIPFRIFHILLILFICMKLKNVIVLKMDEVAEPIVMTITVGLLNCLVPVGT
jgi:hypothetical protein